MANIRRTEKRGYDWTVYDLFAYNIRVNVQCTRQFFGNELDQTLNHLDPVLLSGTLESLGPPAVPEDPRTEFIRGILEHFSRVRFEEHLLSMYYCTEKTLREVGFEECGISIARFGHEIPLVSNESRYLPAIPGRNSLNNTSSLCYERPDGIICMVVRVAVTARSASHDDPEAQVVAAAIGAFQRNNLLRTRSGLGALDKMTIPGIAVLGTRPIFYKVPVTTELSEAVITGQFPAHRTEVEQCAAVTNLGRLAEEMDDLEFRKVALRHYDAFKAVAEQCWSTFSPGSQSTSDDFAA